MLASNGFPVEVAQSRDAWRNRDREGAFEAISKDMVHAIQVIGETEEISDRLRQRSDDGADVQLIPMPNGTTDEVERQLKAFID